MAQSFLPVVAALRAAAEPTRLRLLALLNRGELTVGELCDILGQSQPRISRHLKVLSDAGLLDRFREQSWVYYRTPTTGEARETAGRLLELIDERDDVLQRDRRRLEAVVAARRRQAEQSASPAALPREIDEALLAEMGHEPIGALLDVGTGSGHLLGLLGPKATRAVGIDISSEALRLARSNVHGAGLSHCELHHGDMYDLPFPGALFDTATIDRTLAQAERPHAALSEVVRTLKAGGRILVVEDFDRLSERGDANPLAALRGWFLEAGVDCERIHPIDTEHGLLLIALGRRVAAAHAAA